MNLGNKLIIIGNLMITKTHILRFVISTIINFVVPLAFLFTMGHRLDLILYSYIAIAILTFLHILLTMTLALYTKGILTQNPKPQSTNARSPVAKNGKLSFTNILVEQVEIAVLYCSECDVYLPLKGFHCDSCGVCYEDYKRHSFLINNCITRHNLSIYLCYLLINVTNYALIFSSLYTVARIDNDVFVFVMLMISASCFGFTFALYNLVREIHGIGLNKAMLIDAYALNQKVNILDRQYWTNIKNYVTRKEARLLLKRKEANIIIPEEN